MQIGNRFSRLSFPSTPTPAVPVAPSPVVGVKEWLNSLPGQTQIGNAVEQNPTAQGLIFRRQFLLTEVMHFH